MATVFESLKQAIKADGRSQNQLSRDSGVTVAAISRFLAGKRGLSVEAVEALARALGLDVRLVKSQHKGR
jgi:transcriptional regulator with XRE-family HTH domain